MPATPRRAPAPAPHDSAGPSGGLANRRKSWPPDQCAKPPPGRFGSGRGAPEWVWAGKAHEERPVMKSGLGEIFRNRNFRLLVDGRSHLPPRRPVLPHRAALAGPQAHRQRLCDRDRARPGRHPAGRVHARRRSAHRPDVAAHHHAVLEREPHGAGVDARGSDSDRSASSSGCSTRSRSCSVWRTPSSSRLSRP